MNRTQESGAYLGGIGTMLEVSHGCPACGQVHEGSKFGIKHRAPRECPLVIIGSFPLVSIPPPPAEAPIQLPEVARPRKAGSREGSKTVIAEPISQAEFSRARLAARGLGVPWLPPPDLGEVL